MNMTPTQSMQRYEIIKSWLQARYETGERYDYFRKLAFRRYGV